MGTGRELSSTRTIYAEHHHRLAQTVQEHFRLQPRINMPPIAGHGTSMFMWPCEFQIQF